MADVQMIGGLIQDEHLRSLRHGTGDEHHLPFSAGQPLNAPMGEARHAQLLHGGSHDLFLVLLVAPGVEAHGHHILHGKVEGADGILPHIADHRGQFSRRKGFHGPAVEGDLPSGLGHQTKGGLDERGFPTAVGAHDADHLPFSGLERGAFQDVSPPQLDLDVFIANDHLRRPPYPFLIMRNMKKGAPMKAVTMPMGSSTAPKKLRAKASAHMI